MTAPDPIEAFTIAVSLVAIAINLRVMAERKRQGRGR